MNIETHVTTDSIETITLYDDSGIVDGELSLQEIRDSIEKRQQALDFIFRDVTEDDIDAAHVLLNEASSWQVRLELMLQKRGLDEIEKHTIMQILLAASQDEFERSVRNNGVHYSEDVKIHTNLHHHSPLDLINLIIHGQAIN